jgi:hypothetical protein
MVWVVEHGHEVASALVGILTGLIGIFMLVPGDEPERTLQKIVDVLAKFSKK